MLIQPTDFKRLYEHDVGTMFWTKDEEDRRILRVVFPASKDGTGKNIIDLYVYNNDKDWTIPGEHKHWDGNEQKPTLKPSILVSGGWHGYIQKGELVQIKDKKK